MSFFAGWNMKRVSVILVAALAAVVGAGYWTGFGQAAGMRAGRGLIRK